MAARGRFEEPPPQVPLLGADLLQQMGKSLSTCSSSSSTAGEGHRHRRCLRHVLAAEVVDKQSLADMVWLGVPQRCRHCGRSGRAEAWQVLLGYQPLAQGRRHSALHQKRLLYSEMRQELYQVPPHADDVLRVMHLSGLPPRADLTCSTDDYLELEQIRRDLPRLSVCTATSEPLRSSIQEVLEDSRVIGILERVLHVWAVRQPSPGYVQGLLDVSLPFLLLFLSHSAGVEVEALEVALLDELDAEALDAVEADCYWCLARLLSELMDNYTEGQPGLQRSAAYLHAIFDVVAPDFNVLQKLEEHGLQVQIILARWLGCLMVREVSIPLCMRLWDTLIAEVAISQLTATAGSSLHHEGLSPFLICLCAAMLLQAPASLADAPTDELMCFFVQRSALSETSDEELAALISEAYVLLTSSYARAVERSMGRCLHEHPANPLQELCPADALNGEAGSCITSTASSPSLAAMPAFSEHSSPIVSEAEEMDFKDHHPTWRSEADVSFPQAAGFLCV